MKPLDRRSRARLARVVREVARGQRDIDEDLDGLLALSEDGVVEKAREDFNVFCVYVFGLTPTWFHREWSAAANTHQRLLIVAPRYHAKTQWSVMRLAWLLGRNPNLRIKIVAQSDSKARERLFQVRDALEHNERLRRVFPHLTPAQGGDWTKSKIVLARTISAKDASLEALGITSTATGGRADLILFDDVVDLRNAVQMPQMRETIKLLFKSVWSNMLGPESKAIYICTKWHQCIPSDEWVLTARGRVAARDLSPHDMLRVAPGIWRPPVAISRQWHEGSIVEVSVAGQPKTYRFTANHRLPTSRGLLYAEELREGDELMLFCGPVETMSDDELAHLEPSEPSLRQDAATGVGRIRDRKPRVTREELASDLAEGMTYDEIARKRGICRKSHVLWLINYYGLPHRSKLHRAKHGWIREPKFWRLAGYWLAEGCHTDGNGATRLTFGWSDEEKEFAEDAALCVREALGVEPNVYDRAHSTLVAFSCRTVGRWLRDTFGDSARSKRLPPWLERLPQPLLEEFIRAYWIGDGSFTGCGVRFSTSSMDLAYDIARVLTSRFGVVARVYETVVNDRTRYETRVSITDGEKLGLPIRAAVQKHRPTVLRHDDRAAYFRVQSVRAVPYSGWVYDIQTETGYFDLAGITSHNSDLTHELLKNPEWKIIEYNIGSPEDAYRPLWPEMWPREALIQREREIGKREFDRAFRNIALSDDEALVPREVLARSVRRDLTAADIPREWPKFVGVDLAIGHGDDNCFFFLIVGAVDDDGRRWLAEARRMRIPSPEQARQVIDVWKTWQPNVIHVENNGYQEALVQWIREMGGEAVPVKSFTTGRNKADLKIGLPSLRVEFENGAWIIPMGDAPHDGGCTCAKCELLEEIATYPIGKYSDGLMALWFMREAIRIGSTPAASGSVERVFESPSVASRMEFDREDVPRGWGCLGIPRPSMPFPAECMDLMPGIHAMRDRTGQRRSIWDRAREDTLSPVVKAQSALQVARRIVSGAGTLADIAEEMWPFVRDALASEVKRLADGADGEALARATRALTDAKALFDGRPCGNSQSVDGLPST